MLDSHIYATIMDIPYDYKRSWIRNDMICDMYFMGAIYEIQLKYTGMLFEFTKKPIHSQAHNMRNKGPATRQQVAAGVMGQTDDE